jgi:hypothetical protein
MSNNSRQVLPYRSTNREAPSVRAYPESVAGSLALRHSISTPGLLWSSLKYHKYSRSGPRSPGADLKHLTTKSLDDTFGISSKNGSSF